MKKTLMILGAGQCQVPIIRKAHDMGYETVAVSKKGDYPGFAVADKSYEIDVREKEYICAIARKEKICGVLTDQTDITVPTVSYVAEKLNLAGIGYECALNFTNKFKMRRLCESIGVQVPKYFKASTLSEAMKQAKDFVFPIVVKPVDSQGSRGVSRVNSIDELGEIFENSLNHSPSRNVILEEYFSGKEVVVQGIVLEYDFLNLIIGDRYYFDFKNIFIPKQTIFPSTIRDDLKKKIFNLNSNIINSFGPKFGITHSEFLVNEKTDEIRLVETAIRGGGVFISSDLIPLACGVDANELLIKCVVGDDPKIDKSRIYEKASGYICFCLPEGAISRAEGVEKVSLLKGVHKEYLENLFIGKRTAQISDKTSRMGPILFFGDDRRECQETILKIQDTLLFEIITSDGKKNAIW